MALYTVHPYCASFEQSQTRNLRRNTLQSHSEYLTREVENRALESFNLVHVVAGEANFQQSKTTKHAKDNTSIVQARPPARELPSRIITLSNPACFNRRAAPTPANPAPTTKIRGCAIIELGT
jgi:hypothetical protein